jgi:hypothetical protein
MLSFAIIGDLLLWLFIAAFALWRSARFSGFRFKSAVVLLVAFAMIGSLTAIFMAEEAAWLKGSAAVLPLSAMAFLLSPERSLPAKDARHWRHLSKLTGSFLLFLAMMPIVALAGSIADAPERSARLEAEFARAEAEAAARSAASVLEQRKRFDALGPSSRLDDFLEFLLTSDEQARPALVRAQQSRSRQSDAIRLLNDGRILDLGRLHQLYLDPDETLCAAYRTALMGSLQPGTLPSTGMPAEPIDYQGHVANLAWLKAHGCDVREIARHLSLMLKAQSGQTSAPAFLVDLERLGR